MDLALSRYYSQSFYVFLINTWEWYCWRTKIAFSLWSYRIDNCWKSERFNGSSFTTITL